MFPSPSNRPAAYLGSRSRTGVAQRLDEHPGSAGASTLVHVKLGGRAIPGVLGVLEGLARLHLRVGQTRAELQHPDVKEVPHASEVMSCSLLRLISAALWFPFC